MKNIFLFLSLLFLVSCNSNGGASDLDENNSLYENVTTTHLPASGLEGLSMDARPADLDADGDLDMVVANEFKPNILLLNDGQGRFSLASERLPRTSHDSEDIGIADFDGDGDPDIVIVSEDDQTNELYLNDGMLLLQPPAIACPSRGPPMR